MFKSLEHLFRFGTSLQQSIWKPLTPSFILNNPHPYGMCASWRRPFLYMLMDNAVYEISLLTGYRPRKIRQYDNLKDPAIACDFSDNLYLQHGIWPNYEYIYLRPESLLEERWAEETFTDSTRLPNQVRDHFVRYYNPCRYSCVDGDRTYHYCNGEDWTLYSHVGDVHPPLELSQSRPTWVCPDQKEIVFGFQTAQYAQVWRTQGEKYHLVWQRQSDQDPLYVIYSPVERTLYGLHHEKDNSYYLSTYLAVHP